MQDELSKSYPRPPSRPGKFVQTLVTTVAVGWQLGNR